MINQFLMEKRCCSRLEKFVSDRVWSEPYAELRTNTRPRILNAKTVVESAISSGEPTTECIYSATAGVLTGTGEQVTLPSSSLFYVYSIELNQFRSIKANALEWVTLEEYCSGSRTDIKLYTDSGIVLWRGGIYMKQDKHAEAMLVAVDANMFHKLVDEYEISTDGGRPKLVKKADPSKVFFTKYVESDYVADDIVKCIKFDAYAVSQLKKGISAIPRDTSLMFLNGRVASGQMAGVVKTGDYLECIVDKDIKADFPIDRKDAPIYLLDPEDESSGRFLIHIPRVHNQENNLLTYNTCDVYILPKRDNVSGRYVHICDREKVLHQITHNDFSVDLSVMDRIAADAGADVIDEVPEYVVRVIVRNYSKKSVEDSKLVDKFIMDNALANAKFGAVRDFNYCDLLYSDRHDDATIVKLLLGDEAFSEYELDFWTARHLEQNNYFAKEMHQRVGPTTANIDNVGKFRAPIEKEYLPGEQYAIASSSRSEEDLAALHEDIGTGVKNVSVSTQYQNVTSITPGTRIIDGTLKFKPEYGDFVTPGTQCQHCGLFEQCVVKGCNRYVEDENGVVTIRPRFTEFECEDFSYRKMADYVRILGYYHVLSLICKRVTTYYVRSTVSEDSPNYGRVAVRPPIAFYDLPYDKFHAVVYINGIKVDQDKVAVERFSDSDIPGMVEQHWTYTPRLGENDLWEEDRRRLLIKVDEPFSGEHIGYDGKKVNGDYIAVEILPMSDDPNEVTVATAETEFDLDQSTDDLTSDVRQYAFEPIGVADTDVVPALASELVYLNGRQLVAGIDYTKFSDYAEADKTTVLQNLQYLYEISDDPDAHHRISYTCTTDVTVGSAKGFVVGNWIPWDGISPFWFDNLSILTVGGRVCSNFAFKYSGLDIRGEDHQNGEPFMVRTLVPQKVIDMLGTDEIVNMQQEDLERRDRIRAYFDSTEGTRGYRALIPYSHKIYSTYLLAIITDFLSGDIDFEMYQDRETFVRQFDPSSPTCIDVERCRGYENIKKYDVVYASLSQDDLRFVDIYPMYHKFDVGSRYLRNKITHMVEMLSPSDEMRHRGHTNV